MRAHKTASITVLLLKKETVIQRYGDTAIREPEPGTGTGTAHNLCKLSHFITAGEISDNIYQGGGENHFRGIC